MYRIGPRVPEPPLLIIWAKLTDAARNAVRLDPNDGETQLVLGFAFAYQGMADQTLEQFAKAEALAPNNADLLIKHCMVLPSIWPTRSGGRTYREGAETQSQLPVLVQPGGWVSFFLAASLINP